MCHLGTHDIIAVTRQFAGLLQGLKNIALDFSPPSSPIHANTLGWKDYFLVCIFFKAAFKATIKPGPLLGRNPED